MKQLIHLVIVILLSLIYYTWFNTNILSLFNPLFLYILSCYILSGWRQSFYAVIYCTVFISLQEYSFIWPVTILIAVLIIYIILHKTFLHSQSIRSIVSLQLSAMILYLLLTASALGFIRGFVRTDIYQEINTIILALIVSVLYLTIISLVVKSRSENRYLYERKSV